MQYEKMRNGFIPFESSATFTLSIILPRSKAGNDAPGAKHTDRTFPCQDPLRIGCAPVQRSILDPHGVLPV